MRRGTNLGCDTKTWQPCMPSFQGVESTIPSGPTADAHQSASRKINFNCEQKGILKSCLLANCLTTTNWSNSYPTPNERVSSRSMYPSQKQKPTFWSHSATPSTDSRLPTSRTWHPELGLLPKPEPLILFFPPLLLNRLCLLPLILCFVAGE